MQEDPAGRCPLSTLRNSVREPDFDWIAENSPTEPPSNACSDLGGFAILSPNEGGTWGGIRGSRDGPSPIIVKECVMDRSRRARLTRLLVHELRNPLNVLKLTLYVMAASKIPDQEPDLQIMEQHVDEMDRMLQMLIDHSELPEDPSELAIAPMSPKRMVEELLEEIGPRLPEVRIVPVIGPDSPELVELDPLKARMALTQAIRNGAAAAVGLRSDAAQPEVTVKLGGGGLGCRIEVGCEWPPPKLLQSTDLDPVQFERLVGVPNERRGLDLVIVAGISEVFGGKARLEVEPEVRSSIVLDWPLKLSTGG